ncbi:MAG: WD40 repeat domain-containing protein [Marinicella sp.]
MSKQVNNATWQFTPTTPLQINSVSISDDGTRCAFGSSFERGSGTFYTYLFDDQGNQLWKQPISSGETYQGVFWVAVSGDGQFVASGGETSDSKDKNNLEPGYLQAFAADSAQVLLNINLYSRINQVSLSHDGQYLAVCYGHTIEIYQLNEAATAYASIFKDTSTSYSINSCVISHDGSTVVASGIQYADDNNSTPSNDATTSSTTSTCGQIVSYSINNGTVSPMGQCTLDSTGCMRVAVTDNGQIWAASLHDGSCVLVHSLKPNELAWQCKPDQSDLSLAYAVDVTQTDMGDVYVACGANLDSKINGGFLYLVKSVRMVYADDGYPEPYFKGIIQWSTPIQFGVNPGVSLDKNATYVTATDGKPDGQTVKESAGSFYLFEAATGTLIWQQNTNMMNWPMMLAQDGGSVIGGSDNGSVYYWSLNN